MNAGRVPQGIVDDALAAWVVPRQRRRVSRTPYRPGERQQRGLAPQRMPGAAFEQPAHRVAARGELRRRAT